ncbi:hypothetical protein ACSVDA_02145 [Cytobacillus sp. Hm23]
MYRLFLRCLELKQPIEVIYMSKSGQITQRILRVEQVTPSYVKAYCMLRHEQRTFNLANILSAIPVSQ